MQNMKCYKIAVTVNCEPDISGHYVVIILHLHKLGHISSDLGNQLSVEDVAQFSSTETCKISNSILLAQNVSVLSGQESKTGTPYRQGRYVLYCTTSGTMYIIAKKY